MRNFTALIVLITLLFVQCQWYQNLPKADYETTTNSYNNYSRNNSRSSDYPPKAESGKCYAKCMIADVYDIEEIELAIYTGNEDEEDVEIVVEDIEIRPASTKWIRQKADRDCFSNDPNDCLVWALVEIPAVIETYKVVIDTTQTNNYEIQTVERKELAHQGGFTEWRDVLCPGDITVDLIHQVQDNLKVYGYDPGPPDDIMGKPTKTALIQFQKDNGLPIGNLDFQTLDVLNINY